MTRMHADLNECAKRDSYGKIHTEIYPIYFQLTTDLIGSGQKQSV